MKKRFSRSGLISVVVAIVVVAALGTWFWWENHQDPNKSSDVVSAYVAALQRGDEKAILKLIPHQWDAAALVHAAVQHAGGQSFASYTITAKPNNVDGAWMTYEIQAVKVDGSKFDEPVNLQLDPVMPMRGHWYVVMGKYTGKDRIPDNILPTSNINQQ